MPGLGRPLLINVYGPITLSLTATPERAALYPCPFNSRWNHMTYLFVFSLYTTLGLSKMQPFSMSLPEPSGATDNAIPSSFQLYRSVEE